MKKKHIIVLVILVVVVAAVIAGIALIKTKLAGIEKQLDEVTINDINLAGIADGIYSGSCAVFPVAAEVKVTVKDHAITAVELIKHDHGQGEAAEVIPDMVVEAQSLDVDTITGATYSSKIILKAIENALTAS